MKFLSDLRLKLTKNGFQAYRANQVFKDLFKKGIDDYNEMTTLPADVKELLGKNMPIFSIHPVQENKSSDGATNKILFKLSDDSLIEAVLMKFNDGRNTVCVSSQVGCAMNCKFCATGTLSFTRNLTYEEIADQVLYFSLILNKTGERINHVVYMGMGEPFMNYDEMSKSINMLRDSVALNIGSRNITVSTCGIIPGIKKFSKEFDQVNLAISLHAPSDEIRNEIMPISKKYPLDQLMKTCEDYIQTTHRRITFEYVMLAGINDSEKNAYELASLLRGMLCLVNIIPYNETSIKNIKGSDKKKINKFKNVLLSNHIQVTVRVSLGQDINAACGQLAGKK
ncbi:23S rRNA (adenine(2503)-C(2))-methyltransferase RlmN [bacterium]|nr:23S rRNA (adenine(2503)-C(2))-methyltransferase RlmN [bacterium]